MEIITGERLRTALRQAPEAVRDMFGSERLAKVLTAIQSKYGLHLDVIGNLDTGVNQILIGLTTPAAVMEDLARQGIPQDTLRNIANDLNKDLFLPLREEVQHPKPKQEEEETYEEEPSPMLPDASAVVPPVPVNIPTGYPPEPSVVPILAVPVPTAVPAVYPSYTAPVTTSTPAASALENFHRTYAPPHVPPAAPSVIAPLAPATSVPAPLQFSTAPTPQPTPSMAGSMPSVTATVRTMSTDMETLKSGGQKHFVAAQSEVPQPSAPTQVYTGAAHEPVQPATPTAPPPPALPDPLAAPVVPTNYGSDPYREPLE